MTLSLDESWRTSSRCDSTHCVQVRLVGDSVQVRDSKNPQHGALHLDRDQWRSLLAAVAGGAYDFS